MRWRISHRLATGDMNLRFERLNRLWKEQPTWTHYSPGIEQGVPDFLSRHWPLDLHNRGRLIRRRTARAACRPDAMKQKTIIAENPPEPEGFVVERPDGFHWQSEDGRREGGPFATLVEALEDMHHGRSEDDDTAVSFQEAEADTGMDWVDEETGEAAEDASFHIAE